MGTNAIELWVDSALVDFADLGDLVGDWLEYERKFNEASQGTITAYERGIDVFASWMIDNAIAPGGVLPLDVAQFKTDLGARYSAQTVNLRLAAVRSFYRWAVVTGRLPSNPASQVKGAKRPKSKAHKRDALTGREILAVLATCDGGTLEGLRDKAILTLCAYCGLRSIEVYRADLGDLATQGDRLTLWVQGKGHTEKDEYVIIPYGQEGAIMDWLAQRLTFNDSQATDPLFVSFSNRTKGKRLSRRAIRGLVKARYRVAGVVGARKSTHSLRHSAITNAIRRGATPRQAQSFARHGSYDTTLGYFHETSRLDNPAEDLIDYSNGNGTT